MNTKTLVIFGAKGMLGSCITKYFSLKAEYKIIQFTRKDLDILQIDDIPRKLIYLFHHHQITDAIIINAIGLIPQVNNNNDMDYIKINSLFPLHLSNIAVQFNCKLIHATTDCVFSGLTGKYNEYSLRDAPDIYGQSKILGENIYGTIIRTSIIGHQENGNYSLLEWLRSNKNGKVDGYVNHYWNGITCLEFAKQVDFIIQHNLFWLGIRHIFSDIVSKFTLLKTINNIYDLNVDIKAYSTNTVDKTLTTVYDTKNLKQVPDIFLQIQEMYHFYHS